MHIDTARVLVHDYPRMETTGAAASAGKGGRIGPRTIVVIVAVSAVVHLVIRAIEKAAERRAKGT